MHHNKIGFSALPFKTPEFFLGSTRKLWLKICFEFFGPVNENNSTEQIPLSKLLTIRQVTSQRSPT